MTRIAVVDCGSARVRRIHERLREGGAGTAAVPLAGAVAAALGGFDGVVVSGGPHLFTGPAGGELAARFGFLGSIRVPLLGICLGHQAIGLASGVAVFRGAERRGPERVAIGGPHALLAGLGPCETFVADHVEGIPLPPGFVGLGASPHYPVEIMAAVDRPLFGVQFHPEDSGTPGARLIANFLDICRAACGSAA